MRFDINRLSKLAGINAGKKQTLTESSNRSLHDDGSVSSEADYRFGKNQLSEKQDKNDEEDEDLDEVIEVNEADLVAELRRLRKIAESKKRKNKKQSLQEAQLKTIIEHEVKHILDDIKKGKIDLNISADWVYGNNKPQNSRRGYVARAFKGVGFK
jgi:hypothetical protein